MSDADFSYREPLRFPNRCACCDAEATTTSELMCQTSISGRGAQYRVLQVPYCALCARHASTSAGIDRPFSFGNQFFFYIACLGGSVGGIVAVLAVWEDAPGWAPLVGMVAGMGLGAFVGSWISKKLGQVTDRMRDAAANKLRGPDCTTSRKAVTAAYASHLMRYRLYFTSDAYRQAFRTVNPPVSDAQPGPHVGPSPMRPVVTAADAAWLKGLGVDVNADDER